MTGRTRGHRPLVGEVPTGVAEEGNYGSTPETTTGKGCEGPSKATGGPTLFPETGTDDSGVTTDPGKHDPQRWTGVVFGPRDCGDGRKGRGPGPVKKGASPSPKRGPLGLPTFDVPLHPGRHPAPTPTPLTQV